MYRNYFKRVIDISGALLGLLVLSPVFLLVAILIKIFDPGPVIFKQKRIGIQAKVFLFYKFRSMPVNTGDITSDKLGKINLRWIGRFIRRTNLDELPQLVNILIGDMSFVGPRPPIITQEELISLRISNGAILCRPGLTGLAQVSSYDGMSVAEKARFDGDYAQHISFINDVIIVFRTVGYLMKPPPVY